MKKKNIDRKYKFFKGKIYDTSDIDMPKDLYGDYFENEDIEDDSYERQVADVCKKSFELKITITEL